MRLIPAAITTSLFLLAVPIKMVSQDPGTAPPPPPYICPAERMPLTAGDRALAAKDFNSALEFYRYQLQTNRPAMSRQEARLGLVRSLIGKDQLADALKESQAALDLNPGNALSEIAAGEAAYRNADFESMRLHAAAAGLANPCEGRALALAAQLNSLHGLFATAAGLLDRAHQLRPGDEIIRRAWIQSLPRRTRVTELASYLDNRPSLSTRDRTDLTNIEDHLRGRRPDECRITTHAPTVDVPLVLVFGAANQPDAFGLNVDFNGKRRRMQIDTGASGIVLTTAAARRLGLVPEYYLSSTGVGDDGEVDSYLTHVASIRIGDVEVSDCMVEVLQNAKLTVDGLIGIDVFDRWLVTLDYQNSLLHLNPLPIRTPSPSSTSPGLNSSASATLGDTDNETVARDAIVPPGMSDWLRVVRVGHELLLPSSLNGGLTHYLIADTGADRTMLSLPFAREAGTPHDDPDLHIKGISGAVKKVYRIDNASLQFGSLRLPPSSLPALDITNISHDTGVEISGLIGLPTLSRLTITIDYRDNLMLLK